MWTWSVEPADVAPSGYGFCGGEILEADANSVCSSTSSLEPTLFIQPELVSTCSSSSSLDISGYGIRECYSAARTSSAIDIGWGLTVVNGTEIVSTNTNVITVDGTLLAASGTLNRIEQVTIAAPPLLELDGGDSTPNIDEVEGGDSTPNEAVIDGGDADRTY